MRTHDHIWWLKYRARLRTQGTSTVGTSSGTWVWLSKYAHVSIICGVMPSACRMAGRRVVKVLLLHMSRGQKSAFVVFPHTQSWGSPPSVTVPPLKPLVWIHLLQRPDFLHSIFIICHESSPPRSASPSMLYISVVHGKFKSAVLLTFCRRRNVSQSKCSSQYFS